MKPKSYGCGRQPVQSKAPGCGLACQAGSGDLTAEERTAFARWLAEDPNRAAIKDAAAFWYGLNAPLSQLAVESRAADRNPLLFSRLPANCARLLARFRVATAAAALVAPGKSAG